MLCQLPPALSLSAEKTVDCRGSQVINEHEYKRVLRQRRLMAVATFGTFFGILLLIIAILTPKWATIEFVNKRNERVNVQLGVWGEYRSVNTSNKVEWISHFPEPDSDRFSRLAGVYLKHYYRVQAAFSVIALAIMMFGNGMAIYTFSHHRYMFKRHAHYLQYALVFGQVASEESGIHNPNSQGINGSAPPPVT
uniref:Col_cuticle_N domain-containing protein n=1 Tax=Globodera pallida TaxID=36090 RepID=A0A183BV23_GLOPA